MIIYLVTINAIACILMLVDKFKAKKNLWRIPEWVLFASAILGGSIGALGGMYLVRHKTKHLKFVIGIPCLLALQLAAVYYFRDYLF